MAIPVSELPARLAEAIAAKLTCISTQLLLPRAGTLSHRHCWEDSPVNLQMQISGSVSCFLKNSTSNIWRKRAKLLNVPVCCAPTHTTTKSLAGFLFPSVETHYKDQACKYCQRPKWPLTSAPSSGIPIHLVFVAFTVPTSLNIWFKIFLHIFLVVTGWMLGFHDLLHPI